MTEETIEEEFVIGPHPFEACHAEHLFPRERHCGVCDQREDAEIHEGGQ